MKNVVDSIIENSSDLNSHIVYDFIDDSGSSLAFTKAFEFVLREFGDLCFVEVTHWLLFYKVFIIFIIVLFLLACVNDLAVDGDFNIIFYVSLDFKLLTMFFHVKHSYIPRKAPGQFVDVCRCRHQNHLGSICLLNFTRYCHQLLHLSGCLVNLIQYYRVIVIWLRH